MLMENKNIWKTTENDMKQQNQIKKSKRKQGEWLHKKIIIRTPTAKNHYCSICGYEVATITPYCAECGAEMVKFPK